MTRRIRPFRIRFACATVLLVAGVLGTALWVLGQANQSSELSSLLPAGATMYLEAKDFQAVLSQWNRSKEKQRWLSSDNFIVLSRSRLLQRLSQAQDEFAAIAGLPLQMNFVDQVAGGRSAFAFYNLSRLSFVYISEIPQGRVDTTDLWRQRASYQARTIAGIPFYTKSDVSGQRSIAFASYKQWFLLASDETRMADALALLSGQNGASISTEPWFKAATQKAQTSWHEQGDLRLVYNLDALIPTPQFRTYWIQRNVSELKAFSAGISDLSEQKEGFEEHRALICKLPNNSASSDHSLSEALRYAPAQASLYRGWTAPDKSVLTDTLRQVLYGNAAGSAVSEQMAPNITAEFTPARNVSDLETRIDQPPFQRSSQQSVTPVVEAIAAMQPLAIVHIQSTEVLDDRVFVMPNSGVVLICSKADRAALDRALAGVTSVTQTGPLDPLQVSIAGNSVILTRIGLRRGAEVALPTDATYTAVYNNSVEWPHYKAFFDSLDGNPASPKIPGYNREPTFFSGNLQSIGEALSRLRQASIVTQRQRTIELETVRYELSQP